MAARSIALHYSKHNSRQSWFLRNVWGYADSFGHQKKSPCGVLKFQDILGYQRMSGKSGTAAKLGADDIVLSPNIQTVPVITDIPGLRACAPTDSDRDKSCTIRH